MDISPIVVERFGQTMREKLTTGEVPLRKAYLGAIIDRVEVDDRAIRIVGRKVFCSRLFSPMAALCQGFAVSAS